MHQVRPWDLQAQAAGRQPAARAAALLRRPPVLLVLPGLQLLGQGPVLRQLLQGAGGLVLRRGHALGGSVRDRLAAAADVPAALWRRGGAQWRAAGLSREAALGAALSLYQAGQHPRQDGLLLAARRMLLLLLMLLLVPLMVLMMGLVVLLLLVMVLVHVWMAVLVLRRHRLAAAGALQLLGRLLIVLVMLVLAVPLLRRLLRLARKAAGGLICCSAHRAGGFRLQRLPSQWLAGSLLLGVPPAGRELLLWVAARIRARRPAAGPCLHLERGCKCALLEAPATRPLACMYAKPGCQEHRYVDKCATIE